MIIKTDTNTCNNLISLCKDNNIILDGHYLLTSGRHSDKYFNKNMLTCKTHVLNELLNTMMDLIMPSIDFNNIDIITGPPTAGAIIASMFYSRFLYHYTNIKFIYPEKDENGNILFRRGYDKILLDDNNKNILLFEDVITTGSSLLKTIKSLGDNKICSTVVIMDRTNSTFNITNNFIYTIMYDTFISYDVNDCPLCNMNIPLQNPKNI